MLQQAIPDGETGSAFIDAPPALKSFVIRGSSSTPGNTRKSVLHACDLEPVEPGTITRVLL